MAVKIILLNSFSNKWIRFENPIHSFCALTLEEVFPILKKIDAMVSDGFFAAGFISYEAAPAFDPALEVNKLNGFPLCWFALFEKALEFDPAEIKRSTYRLGQWVPSIDRHQYHQDIERIKAFIAKGDTYQVNYTYRLHTDFAGDPLSFFWDLYDNQKTGYAAFLDIGDHAICSVSPELFFALNGKSIISKPMKGTASRGRFLAEDIKQIAWLHDSPKNRAENIMIVDMIRNDLSRIAQTGSVKVDSLYDVEKLQTALQMTSTVAAKTGAPLSKIMAALFPCASITGAPKPRTMEIITELETSPRKLYTGCIGFVAPGGKAQFNVSIRTVLIDRVNSCAEYGIGGGIVWDSTAGDEFDESLTKAGVLKQKQPVFDLLETLLWQPDEGYFLLDYHLKRLQQSAEYFGFPFDKVAISKELKQTIQGLANNSQRIRLLLSKNGQISSQSCPFETGKMDQPVRLKTAKISVNASNKFLFHKTTHRDVYEQAIESVDNCDDVILLNEKQEVTETTIYNIVIRQNHQLLTPPVACGLLPGTFRAWLLDQNKIQEKRLNLADLASCDEIFVINSVRKWQKAILE